MKALIIDDEYMPAEHLGGLIQNHCPTIQEVKTIQDPLEALVVVKRNKPDVLFLDIEMPEMSGFEFIDILGLEAMPPVIFTTAFSTYAVDAFRVHAVDYLLKPINPEQLVVAVDKVKLLSNEAREKKLEPLLENPPEGFDERLALAEGQAYHFLKFDEIIRVEGNGSYSNFYLEDGRKLTVSKRLKIFNTRLTNHGFIKTHQSHLVNMRFIKQYNKSDGGELILEQEHRVPVSTKLRDGVRKHLGLS